MHMLLCPGVPLTGRQQRIILKALRGAEIVANALNDGHVEKGSTLAFSEADFRAVRELIETH